MICQSCAQGYYLNQSICTNCSNCNNVTKCNKTGICESAASASKNNSTDSSDIGILLIVILTPTGFMGGSVIAFTIYKAKKSAIKGIAN